MRVDNLLRGLVGRKLGRAVIVLRYGVYQSFGGFNKSFVGFYETLEEAEVREIKLKESQFVNPIGIKKIYYLKIGENFYRLGEKETDPA